MDNGTSTLTFSWPSIQAYRPFKHVEHGEDHNPSKNLGKEKPQTHLTKYRIFFRKCPTRVKRSLEMHPIGIDNLASDKSTLSGLWCLFSPWGFLYFAAANSVPPSFRAVKLSWLLRCLYCWSFKQINFDKSFFFSEEPFHCFCCWKWRKNFFF